MLEEFTALLRPPCVEYPSAMEGTLSVKARDDHAMQWVELKNAYADKRGYDLDKNRKRIPRTRYSDVAQLVRWWHSELERELTRNPFVRDNDMASRKRWYASKAKIEQQLEGADPSALYPENEWFWTELRNLPLYLRGRKAVPSNSQLLIESVRETVQERVEDVKAVAHGAASAVTGAGSRAVSILKIGAIVAGGLVGAALVLPPVIRAWRKGR